MITKADLLKLANSLPEGAEIDISVNVSRPDVKSTELDRVFVTNLSGDMLHTYKDRYTILATGTKNF